MKPSLVKWVILFGAGVVAVLVLFLFDPATSELFPSCPFRTLTGFYCPGCGSLRAAHQLLHGELLVGFALNPLMVVCLPFACYGFVCQATQELAGRSLSVVFVRPRCIYLLLGVILGFGVLRNCSGMPAWLTAP